MASLSWEGVLASSGAGAELASVPLQVRELEGELDTEQKKMAEAQKGIRKYERRIKELSYQVQQPRSQLQPAGPSSTLPVLSLCRYPSPHLVLGSVQGRGAG